MSLSNRSLLAAAAVAVLGLCPALAAPRQDASGADARHIETLVARGLHPLAVKEARRFLERYPKSADADGVRYRLACALVETGQRDEARELLAALAKRSDFALRGESALRLGRLEWEAERLEPAADALARALAAGPAYLRAGAAQLLGEVEYRRARYAEADQAWQRALEECARAGTPEACSLEEGAAVRRAALAGRAWCAFQSQRYDDVIARIDEFASADPAAELDELWLLAGDAHARAGRHAEARAAFARVRGEEHQELALRGSAFAALDEGDERAAEQGFVRMLERFPRGAHASEAAIQLGALRLRRNDARGALGLLSSAPLARSAEALYWRARCEQQLDRAGAALASLDRALELAPQPELAARVQGLRAQLLLAAGRTDDARSALSAAGSADGLAAAMAEALNGGQLEVAGELAGDLVRRFPESPRRAEAELVLAEQRFQAKDFAGALHAFDDLARKSSDPALRRRAELRAAWAAWMSGARSEAATRFATLEPGAANDAERAELRAQRARCLTELARERSTAGDRAGADQAWRAAIGVDPAGAPAARLALAWSAYDADDAAGAARELDACLRDGGLSAEQRREALELAVFAHAKAGSGAAAAAAWREFAKSGATEERRAAAARSAAASVEQSGDAAGALALLDECVRGMRSAEHALALMEESTWLALGLGRLDEADQRARSTAQIAPRSAAAARACRGVADAWLARKDAARAREAYALATRVDVERDPTQSAERNAALYGVAWCALEAGEIKEARDVLRKLLDAPELGELAPRAAYLAGEAAWRAGDLAAGAAHYRRALDAGLEAALAPRAWLRTAQGELEGGRADAALAALARLDAALAANAAGFDAHDELALTRARALLSTPRRDEGVALLQQLAERPPSAWSARADLALADDARARGDEDEALSRDLRVVARYGGEAERSRALFDAAAAFERRGDAAQARAHLQELLDAHPKSALARAASERLDALSRDRRGTSAAGARRR
ncbi:MAG: tetratricopeptide repeat protein [Planctomycetota bacterium]|nr:MAG: tetratricopeptide repeat protein [Planctomycetota bacterium]